MHKNVLQVMSYCIDVGPCPGSSTLQVQAFSSMAEPYTPEEAARYSRCLQMKTCCAESTCRRLQGVLQDWHEVSTGLLGAPEQSLRVSHTRTSRGGWECGGCKPHTWFAVQGQGRRQKAGNSANRSAPGWQIRLSWRTGHQQQFQPQEQ